MVTWKSLDLKLQKIQKFITNQKDQLACFILFKILPCDSFIYPFFNFNPTKKQLKISYISR